MNEKIAQTKKQLMEASKALFVKFGFDRISMDDIAEAAHKAKRSIYNHFSNKEDLYSSMMEHEFDMLHENLATVFAPSLSAPLSQLQEYLLKRFELIKQSGIWKLVATEYAQSHWSRFSNVHQRFMQFEQWEHDQFVAVWKSMAANPDVVLVNQYATAFADMLQMVLKGLDYTMFVQDNYDKYKDTYAFLITMIINNMKNENGTLKLKEIPSHANACSE